MRTYLVTGGAGFIGSHFLRYLHNNDPEALIVNVDKLTSSGDLNHLGDIKNSPRHVFYRGDIRDEAFMGMVFGRHKPHTLVNFAAESHVDKSIRDSRDFVRTNVEGVRVLLDLSLSHGISKFLQISTDEVYGPADTGAFTEKDRLSPRNPYAASKAAADLMAMAYMHTYGLPVMVTRSANNYGENQHVEKFIPKIIENALALRPIPIYGDGRQIREWMYVGDHCSALWALLQDFQSGEIYNVSSGIEMENIELALTLLGEITDRLDKGDPRKLKIGKGLLEWVEDRKGHDFRYSVRWDKLKDRTGWTPVHDFKEALGQTVEWHIKSEKRSRHADSF